jgi:hypothetical protein
MFIKAPKLVLLGDPFQLGPQMPTWKAIAPGPGYSSSSATATLLEHLHREFAVADGGENLVNFMLDVQYRSNELIQKLFFSILRSNLPTDEQT